jgi:hypothetical protein
MITPFPTPLPSGIVVDIAKPADLLALAGEVRTHGRHAVQGTLEAWHLISLKGRGRTEIIGLGWLANGNVWATSAVQVLDGETAIRVATGETYRLDGKAGTLPQQALEHLWKTLRDRGLVEA